jgi:colanic acid/amylovoran biosynthesis protein
MFGPFENPDLQHTMRQLYDAASLVYARDQLSYSFAKNLIDGSADKLRLAPDITIFVQPDSSTPLPEQPYACVVPNMRVLDRGSAEWQRTYMAELRQTIQLLRSHKLRVILVEHEKTGDDRRLIDELFAEFGGDSVQICDDPSPRRLKAVLGGARLVVASRFHAAVGALSSGTPTIVLGWAHKYNALMADFGAGDFVHDATDEWPHLEGLLLQLIDDQLRSAHQKILRERKEAMRPANDAMWDEAVKLIATA